MLSAARRSSLVRRHNAISFYYFSLVFLSYEIHAYKTAILASRWSTLLEIAGLRSYVSFCRGELTFIITKSV